MMMVYGNRLTISFTPGPKLPEDLLQRLPASEGFRAFAEDWCEHIHAKIVDAARNPNSVVPPALFFVSMDPAGSGRVGFDHEHARHLDSITAGEVRKKACEIAVERGALAGVLVWWHFPAGSTVEPHVWLLPDLRKNLDDVLEGPHDAPTVH